MQETTLNIGEACISFICFHNKFWRHAYLHTGCAKNNKVILITL